MFTELSSCFEQEALDRGGTIVEDFRDADQGYLSAMLPASFRIQAGDELRAGLALKQEQSHARLYVMTHRKLCFNGAITTSLVKQKAIHTTEDLRQILSLAFTRIAPVQLREQGRQYRLLLDEPIDEDRLEYAMEQVRAILMKGRGMPTTFFSKLASDQEIPRDHFVALFRRLLLVERNRPVHQGRSRREFTQFEIVNAITDLAHELPQAHLRWELMELGGELLQGWGKEIRRAQWQTHLKNEKEKQTKKIASRQRQRMESS